MNLYLAKIQKPYTLSLGKDRSSQSGIFSLKAQSQLCQQSRAFEKLMVLKSDTLSSDFIQFMKTVIQDLNENGF